MTAAYLLRGVPEWLTCADLARLRGTHRTNGWRQMRHLRRALGARAVVRRDGRWVARRDAVARYLRTAGAPLVDRLLSAEARVAALEDQVAELLRFSERAARELSCLRDQRGVR